MKANELNKLGIPKGTAIEEAIALLRLDGAHASRLANIVADPSAFQEDAVFGELANAIIDSEVDSFIPREEPAPWKQ